MIPDGSVPHQWYNRANSEPDRYAPRATEPLSYDATEDYWLGVEEDRQGRALTLTEARRIWARWPDPVRDRQLEEARRGVNP